MRKAFLIIGIGIFLMIIYNCWYSILDIDFIKKEDSPIIILSRIQLKLKRR